MDPGDPALVDLAESHRLAIVCAVAIAPAGRLSFAELARHTGFSDGNLACHLRRLQLAGWIEPHRNGARGRASRTEFRLTSPAWTGLEVVGHAFEAAARRVADALAIAAAGRTTRIAPAPSAEDQGRSAAAPEPAEMARSVIEERFEGPD